MAGETLTVIEGVVVPEPPVPPVPDVTVRGRVWEEGLTGFTTVMPTTPTVVAVPVAFRYVLLTKVVGSGEPFHRTTAPFMKFAPNTRSVNDPTGIEVGLSELTEAVGLEIVTV